MPCKNCQHPVFHDIAEVNGEVISRYKHRRGGRACKCEMDIGEKCTCTTPELDEAKP